MRQIYRGFTLIETLIVLGIVVVLITVATVNFNSSRDKKALQVLGQDIVFALEEAKSNAMSGKGGSAYGVRFGTTSYTTFKGSTYNASDSSNVVHTIDSTKFDLSNTLVGTDGAITFARITGAANISATTTISLKSNPADKYEIYIGILGDINVVQ